MLKKEGRRVIENADGLMLHLQQRFRIAKFEILEGKTLATMSLREQACFVLCLSHFAVFVA